MKHILLSICLALLGAGGAYSQDQSYKVVFDLTSRDSLDQKAVMRWIREISQSNPKAQLEVVMYAKGLELVMPDRSSVLNDVNEAMKHENVTFAVCEMSLKNNTIEKSQLLKGVRTVPDAIYEIITKQREGWGYIKVSH